MSDEQYRSLPVTPKPPSMPVRIKKASESRQDEPKKAAAPSGKKSTDTGSHADIVRGSSNIPLSPYGLQQALDIAKKTKGDFTRVIASPLLRAQQTAKAIMETNPDDLPWLETHEALCPWFLGDMEGQPTLDVLDKMQDLIINHPDKTNPGRGPESVHDGCSFNEFKERFLRFLMYLIDSYDEEEKILCVTHFRDIRLSQSWIAAGAMGNMDIDVNVMTAKPTNDAPGDMFMFNPKTRMMKKVERGKEKGIYFLRHGSTAFNQENKGAPSLNTVEPDEKK